MSWDFSSQEAILHQLESQKNTIYILSQGTKMIHRLLFETFKGSAKDLTIDHLDGNKRNNSLDNLEAVSIAENIRRKTRDGRQSKGENCTFSKMDEFKVLSALTMIGAGWRIGVVAKTYGIHANNVTKIINGKTWGYMNLGGIVKRRNLSRLSDSTRAKDNYKLIRISQL